MDDSSIQVLFRQNKGFIQRLNYWINLGYGYNDALRNARISNLQERSKSGFEINDEQIHREIDRLKDLRLMTEIPAKQEIVADAQIFQFRKPADTIDGLQVSWSAPQKLGFDIPAVNEPKTHSKPESVCESIEILVSLTIVIGASWLLIQSSAEFFGFSAEGWLKALLLELGILGLSLYRSEDPLTNWGSKLGAAALIALSVMTLHTGVKKSESKQLTAVAISSETLSLLREDRTRLLATHDALPTNHVTMRNAIMADVQKLRSRIESEKEKAGKTTEAKVIENFHLVESLMRLALIFLNIVFSHRLKVLLERPRAGDIRRAGSWN